MAIIYRALSTCAGIPYGFPMESFDEAMKLKLDLIAADAGSMDPGPYYLGTGTSFAEKPGLKRDFSIMLRGALKQNCPVIIGSSGMAGDTPNLQFMVDIVKEIFEEESVRNLKVAIIDSHVSDGLLIGRLDRLVPLGRMPAVTEGDIKVNAKVAQMGIAPFITALEAGAQVIVAGRACDTAIFAADAVRRGIDPGLAYHAGHVLECGAIACDPGSGSDCLLAEFTDANTVTFTPPNKARRATTYSIAAHSLYEEDHPFVQFYPEGVLSFKDTEYFDAGERSAGLRNTKFLALPLTVKVEGSHKIGERYVSLLPVTELAKIPKRFPVYGRNGVEARHVDDNEREIALVIAARSDDEEVAKTLLTQWKGLFLHFGYPGRRATAGNLAYPISPPQLTFEDEFGEFTSMIIAGTRDPFFQANFESMKSEIAKRMQLEYPELSSRGHVTTFIYDNDAPLLYLQTIGATREGALARHREELRALRKFVDLDKRAWLQIYAGEAFVWGIYHLLTDADAIKDELFPISLSTCTKERWTPVGTIKPAYSIVGEKSEESGVEPEKLATIDAPSEAFTFSRKKPLMEMAKIIRSKNAGVNKITYDLFFNTGEDYEAALRSGIFTKKEMARILGIGAKDVIGTYRADDCRAIKISAYRQVLSGAMEDRDVYGAQQHMLLMRLEVPV